jgi:hypothetical protein
MEDQDILVTALNSGERPRESPEKEKYNGKTGGNFAQVSSGCEAKLNPHGGIRLRGSWSGKDYLTYGGTPGYNFLKILQHSTGRAGRRKRELMQIKAKNSRCNHSCRTTHPQRRQT